MHVCKWSGERMNDGSQSNQETREASDVLECLAESVAVQVVTSDAHEAVGLCKLGLAVQRCVGHA